MKKYKYTNYCSICEAKGKPKEDCFFKACYPHEKACKEHKAIYRKQANIERCNKRTAMLHAYRDYLAR